MRILIVDPHTHRTISFLAHGQKCETWLKEGEYLVVGECILDNKDSTKAMIIRGVEEHNKGTWYVRPDILSQKQIIILQD